MGGESSPSYIKCTEISQLCGFFFRQRPVHFRSVSPQPPLCSGPQHRLCNGEHSQLCLAGNAKSNSCDRLLHFLWLILDQSKGWGKVSRSLATCIWVTQLFSFFSVSEVYQIVQDPQFEVVIIIRMLCGQPVFLILKSRKS